MKFFNIRLYESIQLYCQLAAPWLSDQLMSIITADTTLYDYYSEQIKRFPIESVLYADELKRLILNDDGALKPFDSDIGKQLLELNKRLDSYSDEVWDKIGAASQNIIVSDATKGIKELARLRLHDAKIRSIKIMEKQLEIIVNRYNVKICYQFELVENNLDLNFLHRMIGGKILYEELFENDDKIYEYNVLGNISPYPSDELFELSILIHDVNIEEFNGYML